MVPMAGKKYAKKWGKNNDRNRSNRHYERCPVGDTEIIRANFVGGADRGISSIIDSGTDPNPRINPILYPQNDISFCWHGSFIPIYADHINRVHNKVV